MLTMARLAVFSTALSFALTAAADTAKPDADMKALLDQLSVLGSKPIESLSPADARHQPSMADAVVQLTQSKGVVAPEKLPPVGKVETISMTGPDKQPLSLRVYSPPKATNADPVVVYLHGGGWVLANLDTYDASCRALSSLAHAVVVSVDYRRAPENPFPAATEDAYAAFQFVVDHASQVGGDPKRVAIAGESAGGNLATVVSLMAKERKGHVPVHQLLVYPVTNAAFDTASYRENANAKPLNQAMMKWFFAKYLKDPKDAADIHVSPVRASREQLRGLPPATIITAEIDPLRDDGRSYATKLREAGVDVKTMDVTGVTHEFFGAGLAVDKAKKAEVFATDNLKDAFKGAK